MGLYEVPIFVSLVGLGMGIMFASFYMCGIFMFLLRDMLNMLVRKVITIMLSLFHEVRIALIKMQLGYPGPHFQLLRIQYGILNVNFCA